jgi:hypothetical protein
VAGAASGDHRGDAAGADQAAVLVMVVAAVGVHLVRPAQWPAASAPQRWNAVDERDELGDVVTVAAGQDDLQGYAAGVGDQVVLGTGPAPVDRARPDLVPPFNARRCEASTTAWTRFSAPAARSSASST